MGFGWEWGTVEEYFRDRRLLGVYEMVTKSSCAYEGHSLLRMRGQTHRTRTQDPHGELCKLPWRNLDFKGWEWELGVMQWAEALLLFCFEHLKKWPHCYGKSDICHIKIKHTRLEIDTTNKRHMINVGRKDLQDVLWKINSLYLKGAFYKWIRKRQITWVITYRWNV